MYRSMNIRGFLIILGLILVVFLVLHPILRSNLNQKTEEEKALQLALTQLEDENRDLNARLSVVGTADYIVSSAMENYSYMNRDDIRFEYANPEALYAYSEEEIRIWMDEIGD